MATDADPPNVRRRRRRRVAAYGLAIVGIALLTTGVSALGGSDTGDRSSRVVDLAAIPDSILRRSRVVVLEVDEGELEQLTSNSGRRGRHWERVGRAAFLSDGRVTFQSPAGVRIHGGSSRFLPTKSFRLLFRRSLQASTPSGSEIGLDPATTYESIVLHGDARPDTGTLQFHYTNPIAYAIAERLGVPAARTTPATLVINGGPPLPYMVSEKQSVPVVRARAGHSDVRVFNLRSPEDRERLVTEGPLAELQARFGPVREWTRDQIAEVVDVDNLARWFMTVLYCGTRDLSQGSLVYDATRPGVRWSWMVWDFDMSFGRLDANRGVPPTAEYHRWWLFGRDVTPATDARVVLLRHLFTTSEAFREEFAALFATARDSLLTPEFIDETLATYERAAAEHGVTDTRYQVLVRDFLAGRPAALEQLIDELPQGVSPSRSRIP